MVYNCPECSTHNHHNNLKCAECGVCLHAHIVGCGQVFHYKGSLTFMHALIIVSCNCVHNRLYKATTIIEFYLSSTKGF